jgi:GDP-mannose 6-dehydrogenase
MKIAVFGLGYVGVVNIACLSELGYEVIGVDIKQAKVDAINNGISPLYEPKVDKMIYEGVKSGKIMATNDARQAIGSSDMAIICVGTPSRNDGRVDLSFMRNTVIEIAREIKVLSKIGFCVVLRSTIPPSTVRNLIIPIIKEHLEAANASNDMQVAFIPEFLREGSAVQDFFEGSRIVVGTDGSKPISIIDEVFGYNEAMPLVYVDYETAEFVKYVDNAFHALKVAFANEIYSIGAKFNIDVKKANEIFLMDDSLNISKRYLRPGAPFGGSCLPKDLRAILNMANEVGEAIPLLNGVVQSNEIHKQRFLYQIMNSVSKGDRILIYGMTFKSKTDDTRESPFIEIAEKLIRDGYNISIMDLDIKEVDFRINHPTLFNCWITHDKIPFEKYSTLVLFKKLDVEEFGGFNQIIDLSL